MKAALIILTVKLLLFLTAYGQEVTADNSPKRFPTKYQSIPKGSTNKNTEGYWQEGEYTTIVDKNGKMTLEIS